MVTLCNITFFFFCVISNIWWHFESRFLNNIKYFRRCSHYRVFLLINFLRCSPTKLRCCLWAAALFAQTVCSNLQDQVMHDFDKGLGDQTLVEWEVLTYWCNCSTLWKRPSHGRRLPVRPVRSPGTEDIWCSAAVSSRGRMSLSSWLLVKAFIETSVGSPA